MSHNFSNWEKPNTRTRAPPRPAPPRPAPKTHLVRGWDYQVYSKRERDTLTCPAPGLGRGWERDSDNWDGNGVGVARPKPAPLPILIEISLFCICMNTAKSALFRWVQLQYKVVCFLVRIEKTLFNYTF